MKASAVLKALQSLLKSRQPGFLWGGPGLGKSSVVKQLAAQLSLPIQDVRALLLDPVDLRGLPFLGKDGRSHWATPDFLPKDGAGVLFLDELNAAPAMVQAGCYQLVLDRKLGEYTLPDGWAIVAAGNRDSDRAATNRMPTPLRNRFVHLEFEVDLQRPLRARCVLARTRDPSHAELYQVGRRQSRGARLRAHELFEILRVQCFGFPSAELRSEQ